MQRTAMMLLLALQLPATDPLRREAVEALSVQLAERYQAWLGLDEEEPPEVDA